MKQFDLVKYKSITGNKSPHPHDPEIIVNGNLLVAFTAANTVVELSGTDSSVIWKWSHPKGKRGISHIRDANRLPNGNTLLTGANKLTEIAYDGEIVWQMRVPKIDTNDQKHSFLYKSQRIGINGDANGG